MRRRVFLCPVLAASGAPPDAVGEDPKKRALTLRPGPEWFTDDDRIGEHSFLRRAVNNLHECISDRPTSLVIGSKPF